MVQCVEQCLIFMKLLFLIFHFRFHFHYLKKNLLEFIIFYFYLFTLFQLFSDVWKKTKITKKPKKYFYNWKFIRVIINSWSKRTRKIETVWFILTLKSITMKIIKCTSYSRGVIHLYPSNLCHWSFFFVLPLHSKKETPSKWALSLMVSSKSNDMIFFFL